MRAKSCMCFNNRRISGKVFCFHLVCGFVFGSGFVIYTQKKKFSQYLCFLIKSTILHISLSNFYMSCIIITLHLPVHCVTNNASIRLYQPNFKMHDVHVLRYTGRVIFSYTVRY